MKERNFYLYVSTEEEYNEAVSKIHKIVGTDYISCIEPYLESYGYMPYVSIYCSKRQWKDLKIKLRLEKTWL